MEPTEKPDPAIKWTQFSLGYSNGVFTVAFHCNAETVMNLGHDLSMRDVDQALNGVTDSPEVAALRELVSRLDQARRALRTAEREQVKAEIAYNECRDQATPDLERVMQLQAAHQAAAAKVVTAKEGFEAIEDRQRNQLRIAWDHAGSNMAESISGSVSTDRARKTESAKRRLAAAAKSLMESIDADTFVVGLEALAYMKQNLATACKAKVEAMLGPDNLPAPAPVREPADEAERLAALVH